MKSVLLASFVACVFASCQTLKPIPVENGKLAGVLPLRDNVVYYQTVEDVPGASAETIYRQARRWVAYNTADPKAPFYAPDNLSRDVIGPGYLEPSFTNPERKNQLVFLTPSTDYTVSIECFASKYRMVFTSFREGRPLVGPAALYPGRRIEEATLRPLKDTKDYFRTVDRRILSIVDSFRRFVASETLLK